MRSVIVVAAVVAGLVSPGVAQGAGGPVIPMQGGSGAGLPTRPEHYVAVGVHGDTLLERVEHGGVARTRMLHGRFGVPGVAFDGSTTGLSADGRKLVLAALSRRYPQRRTELLVLDAPALRVDERIVLPGFYTVDAISPYGDRLYLTHYEDPSGLHYEVLGYDIRADRLSRPIVDPREPDEKMLGVPMTRAVSHDGRWAYTLYQRDDDAPFIHALDTRRGTAACIDLDSLAGADPSTLRLTAPRGGGPLLVSSAAGPQALVDRRSFKVLRPIPAAAAPAKPRPAPADTGGGPPWAAAGALAAVLALAAIAAARRRRYERSASLRNAS